MAEWSHKYIKSKAVLLLELLGITIYVRGFVWEFGHEEEGERYDCLLKGKSSSRGRTCDAFYGAKNNVD